MEEKPSRYRYTSSEKETLKVLKMQENDLESLKNSTSSQTSDLKNIRKRVEALAAKLNVSIKPEVRIEDVETRPFTISRSEIPSWESLVERANSEVHEDVVYEDLLSKGEFNYCIEDVKRINEEFKRRTKLSKVDLSFLVVATALQTLRWVIINKLYGDIGESFNPDDRLRHDDKEM